MPKIKLLSSGVVYIDEGAMKFLCALREGSIVVEVPHGAHTEKEGNYDDRVNWVGDEVIHPGDLPVTVDSVSIRCEA